jgi:hypothetical protein
MRVVHVLAATTALLFVALVVEGCGDDSTGANSGNNVTQPSSCPSPCTVGALCYQPAPSSNCDGDWYCWDDSRWHCAPQESGGPGDATVVFESAAPEAGDEGSVEAEAGPD